MTRKRFIKLCMANGESRDEARALANFVLMENEESARINKRWKAWGDTLRFPMSSYEKLARYCGFVGGNK